MYRISYHPRAIKFIKKLSKKDSVKLVLKIKKLSNPPYQKNLNIKKLTGIPNSFRLRDGAIRVIFEINNKKQIIYINDIDFRGNIY